MTVIDGVSVAGTGALQYALGDYILNTLRAAINSIGLVTVAIDPAAQLGALPDLWRPSAMLQFTEQPVYDAYAALPVLGYQRVACAGMGGSDLPSSVALAKGQVPQLRALVDRGATPVLSIYPMPRWLSRAPNQAELTPGGVPVYGCVFPRDPLQWQDFLRAIVGAYSDAGLHLCYDLGNELESKLFWVDSLQDAWTLYQYTEPAIHGRDPLAKVGGCSFANPQSIAAIQGFLAAARRIDFLSVHKFMGNPLDGPTVVANLTSLIAAAGYPKTTPILIPEYNSFTNFPGDLEADPTRAPTSTRYAPFILTALAAYETASPNIKGAMVASLQDFGANVSGGQGLWTRSTPSRPKAIWSTIQAQAALYPVRCSRTVKGGFGVDCVATAKGRYTRSILWRYDDSGPDEICALITGHGVTEAHILPRYTVKTIGF